jgi:lysophospholipase L1-like esterase
MSFNKSVVVLGDSISAGYPLEINQQYVKLLQSGITKYNIAFYQYSIGGATSAMGVQVAPRIYQYGLNPTVVLLALGINDAANGVDPAVYVANLENIALTCMGHGTPVIVGTIDLTAWADICPPGYPASFNSALNDFINRYGFMTFDLLDSRTLSATGAFCIDRIHPNAMGHASIAVDLNPKITVVCDVRP